MVSSILDIIILRFIIPLVLFLVTAARYNAFSFIYLLFLLACPLLPGRKCHNSTIKVQLYLTFLITLSCIFTLSHATLHIVMVVAPPYENAFRTCERAIIAAQIGVQRLDGMFAYRAMRLVLPDIIILSVAVASLVYFSRRSRLHTEIRDHTSIETNTTLHDTAYQPEEVNEIDSEQTVTREPVAVESSSYGRYKRLVRASLTFTKGWSERQRKLWRAWATNSLCVLATIILVCFAGITSPSLPSLVYLLSFLGVCTYWACCNKFNSAPFASLRIFLLVYSGLHVCLYYIYQFPFFQSICKDGDFLARLLGLYYIMRMSCDRPGEIVFPTQVRVVDCIAPPLTMLLYYVLVLETRRWLDSDASKFFRFAFFGNTSNSALVPELWTHGQSHNLPLRPISSSTDKKDASRPEQTAQSVNLDMPLKAPIAVVQNEDFDEISCTSHDVHDDDDGDGVKLQPTSQQRILIPPAGVTATAGADLDEITYIARGGTSSNPARSLLITPRSEMPFDALFGLTPPFAAHLFGSSGNNVATERPFLLSLHYSAIRNSYILTLIAMMAWAVVYRSWLSFILLLSACIIWMVPNSRSVCLYSSPLIVLYAIVLILIQYVYGLNLNSDELPQEATPNGLQLSELGMQRWDNSVGALALQMGFLVCFWLTLRLFIMESGARRLVKEQYQSSEPNPATSDQPQTSGGRSSAFDWPVVGTSLNAFRLRKRRALRSIREFSLTPFLNLSDDERRKDGASAWFSFTLPFGTVDNDFYIKFTEFLRATCVKYWIVVCCMSLLLVSVQQPVVIFRIVYMLMFVYFMFLFQISYHFWRRQMLFFWWIIVVYSVAMLLCIYTFQFDKLPEFWQNTTGLSPQILKAIGLEVFESAALFERLLTPVVFLVVIILQVHYFHEPFLKRSSLERFRISQTAQDPVNSQSPYSQGRRTSISLSRSSSMSNFIEDVNSAFQTVVSKLTSLAIRFTNYFWRFLEIHWIKVVALVILMSAVNEVCAPNVISLVLLVVCFPFPYLHGFFATVSFFWAGLQTIVKMSYQLNAVQFNLTTHCDPQFYSPTTIDIVTWLGLKKVDNFRQYISPLSSVMIVCVIWHAITYRQRQFYNDARNLRPPEGIVFPKLTINSMGYDLLNVVKFACNYGFYKFGLELCHCITVVTACLRADALSVFYLLWLFVFLFTSRTTCARLWLSYMLILAVLIPFQYASCVGLPPELCISYPWMSKSEESNNLLQWLYLPGYYGAPSAHKLTADFFQFAAVALQYRVFKMEQHPDAHTNGGGSNCAVLTDALPSENDRDFVSTKESYLDYLRHLVFYWSYWVSLAIVLATGVVWITLFCLGYMILSFIYLWMGQNVMLRKRTNLIKSWNVIIGYNFCVILAKCSLQLMGCVYWNRMINHCWLIQLFGVRCMNPMSWNNFVLPTQEYRCATVSSGLHWDVICFIFILFQRKVFMTHSFCHVYLDLQVQSQFASRGAYLINRKLMHAINEQAMKEQRSLEKVREKLDRIQKRQAGRNTADITEHYIMLRSGDYYLFEGDPEEDDLFDLQDSNNVSPNDPNAPFDSTRKRFSDEKQSGFKTVKSVSYKKSITDGHPSETQTNQLTSPSQGTRRGSATKRYLNLTEREHLKNAWPSIEPNVLDALSNYADAYNTNRRDCDRTNHNVQEPTHPGKLFGHRRMRSHPEYLRRQFSGSSQHNKNLHTLIRDDIIEHINSLPHNSNLRSVATSPSPLIDARLLMRELGAVGQFKAKSHQTHRRLFSASEAVTANNAHRSDEYLSTLPSTSRSNRRPTNLQLSHRLHSIDTVPSNEVNGDDHHGCRNKTAYSNQLTTSNHSRIDNRNAQLKRTVVDEFPDNMDDYETDEYEDDVEYNKLERCFNTGADCDSDEDDANPPTTSTSCLNPIQLLNRAIELGARSALRQYRRSLLAQARLREQLDATDDRTTAGYDDSIPILTEHQNGLHTLQDVSSNNNSDNDPNHIGTSEDPPPIFTKISAKQKAAMFFEPADDGVDEMSERNPLLSNQNNTTDRLNAPSSSSTKRTEDRYRAESRILPVLNAVIEGSSTNETIVRQRSMSEDWETGAVTTFDETVNDLILPHTIQQCKKVDFSKLPARVVRLQGHQSQMTTDSSMSKTKSAEQQDLSESIQTTTQTPGDDDGSPDDTTTILHIPDEDTLHEHAEGCWSKFKAACMIAYMFLLSSVDSLIRFLNGLTRQYRRIRRTIDQEKRLVKRRVITNLPSASVGDGNIGEQSNVQLGAAVLEIVSTTTPEHQIHMFNRPSQAEILTAKSMKQKVDHNLRKRSWEKLDNLGLQDHEREKAFRQSRSHAFLLLIAIGNLANVYSELFCYFLLILNHMRSSTMLSLPYPLMVFLWGMLSVPRPTKTFWIFLITYTEIVIVIKYIFQFKFFYFNDASLQPTESAEALWLPRLLGIDKNDDYAVLDLIQLISLFLHRGYLKNNGLWRDHTEFAHDLELIVQENKAAQQRSRRRTIERECLTISDIRNICNHNVGSSHPVATTLAELKNKDGNINQPNNTPHSIFTTQTNNKTRNPLLKLRRFYLKMTDSRYNKKVDVYIYMFLCEFISFWIMIFGYVSFGPSTGMGDNAFEFIKTNRIPLPFISMLLVQFIFIIIDRGLFLQKHVLGKFIFQIIHVLLIHGWLSFILPNITKTLFNKGLAPQLLYLIKCIYFSLSAYQIRGGYPRRILGNFLTKNYNYLNLVLFKGYLIIPFLYELRNVMDWMWTSSALSLYHWMELEDVCAKIFVLKCWRRSELAYPTPRGQNRDTRKKALVGGLLLGFFFLCFWGPMTLSSFIGATFDVNPPVLCSFSLSFGGFPPTFEFTSREGNIFQVKHTPFANFIRCYEKDQQTVGFLNNFEAIDLRYVTIDGFSGNIWAITPPSYHALMMKLSEPDSELLLHFHMECRRSTKEIQSSHTSVEDIFSRKLTWSDKKQILNVLNSTGPMFLAQTNLTVNANNVVINARQNLSGNNINPDTNPQKQFPVFSTTDFVSLDAVIPRYVVLKKDRLRGAYALLGEKQTYVNVSFYIHQHRITRQAWWELKERTNNPSSDPCFEEIRRPTLGGDGAEAKILSILTFNERVSDSLFGKVFTNYGIIGMYAAYIFLANRLLRTIYSNISYVIRLEELPHVDRILNLCQEIYLVRENNLLYLEEELVAKLFFLYRSSETMIKWTRHPKHIVDRFTRKPGPITADNDNNDNNDNPSPPQPPALTESVMTATGSPTGHTIIRDRDSGMPVYGVNQTTNDNNCNSCRSAKTHRSIRKDTDSSKLFKSFM